jgi:sRNA-binding carbon storage regulator CsrA
MYIITRRRGQSIQLDFGDQTAVIEVLEFRGTRTVRLGVTAAKSVKIRRLAHSSRQNPTTFPSEAVAKEGGSLPGEGEAQP